MGSQENDPPTLDAATNELMESLNALTKQIAVTSKNYKDPSGQQGLLLRQRMTNAARQIINIIREPGETPYEFSSNVKFQVHLHVNIMPAYVTSDGGDERDSNVHEDESI